MLTTISGAATTLNAQPKTYGSASATTTGTAAQPAPTAGSSFSTCHNANGPFAPFCAPGNGTVLNPGSTYYVTWEASAFPSNTSVILVGNFANASIGGEQAFQSQSQAGAVGWYALSIDDAWRQGFTENYIDLFLTTTSGKLVAGPRLAIAKKNTQTPFQKAKAPTGQSLYIALPTVLGFIVLCVGGGFWWNRKARVVGLGNVMGRRRGYGVGKSRRQRMGIGKKGAIKLQDRDAGTAAEDVPPSFRDDTFELEQDRRRIRDSDLGSLVNTPTRPEFGLDGGGNVFRDEMRRQDGERRI